MAVLRFKTSEAGVKVKYPAEVRCSKRKFRSTSMQNFKENQRKVLTFEAEVKAKLKYNSCGSSTLNFWR